MGLFSFLKSAPDAAEKTLDIIQNAGDAVWFTDEEKAENKKELFKLWADNLAKINDENSPRSLTRRYISVSVIFVWLLLNIVGVAAFLYDPVFADFVFSVVAEQSYIVGGIAVFYFGPHMIGRAVKALKTND